LLLVACTALVPAFSGRLLVLPAVLPVLVLAVLGTVGLLVLARLAGLRPLAATALVAVLLVVAALLLLRTGDPTLPTAEMPSWRRTTGMGLLSPLVDAVPLLLTAPVPAPPAPLLLAPVVLVVALVTLVVTALVLRPGSWLLAPVAGAAALYAAGVALGAGRVDRSGVLAGVLVLTAVAGWALLGRRHAPGTPRARRLLPSRGGVPAALATAAVALVAVVGATLPSGAAFDPRDLVVTPQRPLQATSPMPDVTRWAEETDIALFEVSGQVPQRMHLAVLPRFDGVSWGSAGELTGVGVPAEPDLPPGTVGGEVDVEVQVVDLTGPWAPSAGRLVASDLPEAVHDPSNGSLLVPDGLEPGTTYTVRSRLDTPVDADLAGATVPSGPQVEPYLAVPRVPPDLVTYAQQVTATARTRMEQASAIELAVSARELDPAAASGSSYLRAREFLLGPAGSGGQRGTSEQFATSFAILARVVGLPTRVVVGFDVPDAEVPAGTAGDATTPVLVTSGDARVWAEVYFEGFGWAVFDPTPDEQSTATSPVRQDVLDRLADQEATPDEVSTEPLGTPPAERDAVAGLLPVLAAAGAGLLAALLAAVVVLAVRRVRRTRRHRRAGAAGAWAEVVDAGVLCGDRPRPGEDDEVLARRIGERAGTADAGTLLVRAQREAFAPPGGDADAQRADAWGLATRLVREQRRRQPLVRRVTWWVDPAPLRARSGRTGRRGARSRAAVSPAGRAGRSRGRETPASRR
jgi:transglutaminase-like putative cysteine protease